MSALDELIQAATDEAQDQQSKVWLKTASAARTELAQLRAELKAAHEDITGLKDIVSQREASIGEFLFVQRLPENEKDARIAQLSAELNATTHTADVWERNHKKVVAELEQAKQRIAELGRTLDNAMQDAAELTTDRDAARTDNRLWLDPRTIDVGALTSDSAGRR